MLQKLAVADVPVISPSLKSAAASDYRENITPLEGKL